MLTVIGFSQKNVNYRDTIEAKFGKMVDMNGDCPAELESKENSDVDIKGKWNDISAYRRKLKCLNDTMMIFFKYASNTKAFDQKRHKDMQSLQVISDYYIVNNSNNLHVILCTISIPFHNVPVMNKFIVVNIIDKSVVYTTPPFI